MKKIIKLKHHFDDYECMWNGIEDLYMNKTGESLPNLFFFVLSGVGSFSYLRTDKSELKRMVALGDGRTKKMYEFLAQIVGFEYKHHEYEHFEQALKKAKKEINSGYPVVLGALDMYYLPYFTKLYHNEHIPFHHVLMVGYDDDERKIYLYDGGRTDLLSLSYDELQDCMNCSYPGLSKKNTLYTVRMNESKSKYQIAKEAISKKCKLFLNPPTNFTGYKGFEKFILELPKWKTELNKDDYDKILTNIIMFFGTVPTMPNALKGINEPDYVVFRGGFDKMSNVLAVIGAEYKCGSWTDAALIFEECAAVIEKISDVIIAYLSGRADETELLPMMFEEVLSKMIEGYKVLSKGC